MGRVLVLVGSGLSVVLTIVGMVVTIAKRDNRLAVGLSGPFGGALAQTLFIIGAVLLVALAVVAALVALIGAGRLSATRTIKGLGLVMAALPFFGGLARYFGPWWFFILVGNLLVFLGGMAMEGRLMEAAQATPSGQTQTPT